MNKRPMKETMGAFEPSLLKLFYLNFPFHSFNAKNTEFAVSQHLRDNKSTLNQSRMMMRVENGRGEICIRLFFFLAVSVSRKKYLENVGVVRIVILEWIFQKLVVNLLTE